MQSSVFHLRIPSISNKWSSSLCYIPLTNNSLSSYANYAMMGNSFHIEKNQINKRFASSITTMATINYIPVYYYWMLINISSGRE